MTQQEEIPVQYTHSIKIEDITNNTFRTKKIKIPEDKKLKTYRFIRINSRMLIL